MSANFGQLVRHLEMLHIRFYDLRHTAATNMYQLTGDFSLHPQKTAPEKDTASKDTPKKTKKKSSEMEL